MEETGRWQSYSYSCATRQLLRDHDVPYEPSCAIMPWISFQCEKTTPKEWMARDQRYDMAPLSNRMHRRWRTRVQY